jgi:hypothetical protein
MASLFIYLFLKLASWPRVNDFGIVLESYPVRLFLYSILLLVTTLDKSPSLGSNEIEQSY